MTLQNLYSIRIIFRLLRMVLVFLVVVEGICAVNRLLSSDIGRGLLINGIFIAFYSLSIIVSTRIIENVSGKISLRQIK
jgi:hypothetical protein